MLVDTSIKHETVKLMTHMEEKTKKMEGKSIFNKFRRINVFDVGKDEEQPNLSKSPSKQQMHTTNPNSDNPQLKLMSQDDWEQINHNNEN